MELPFKERLFHLARRYRWFGIVLVVLIFMWEALAHQFFTWFDEEAIKRMKSSWPTMIAALGWTKDHPYLSCTTIIGAICFVLVVWAIFPRRNPSPVIVSPWKDDLVNHWQYVYGTVRRPKDPLQVFVYSPDKRWYPQGDPQIHGNSWRALCYFGNFSTTPGTTFEVAAISGGTKVGDAAFDLPAVGIRSTNVRFRRSAVPAEETRPGIYYGRTRQPHVANEWAPYTAKIGRVAVDVDNALRFNGVFDQGFRYPIEDKPLRPARLIGFRFQSDGDVVFYAHLRTTVLKFDSRYPEWGFPKDGLQEYRVPLPSSVLSQGWHTFFLFLPSLEQHAKCQMDVWHRLSVRGNLVLSHVWVLTALDELPISFLGGASLVSPPL